MSDALFSDLLVIDCASFIAGPAAATMLGDLGARVIKIEPPNGDGYRKLVHLPGMPKCEQNYPWRHTNRNKESLSLDLKDSEQRKILDKLIVKADVFITNYPLLARKKLSLDYDHIRAANPRIVYGSLTPYGENGPEAASTGYDATAWWARSGLMDAVRASSDTPPAVSMPGMGDYMSANALYGAIVTALYRREKTGEGGRVGSSLMANGLWSNAVMVQAALDGADTDKPNDRSRVSAFTQAYRCSDDRWFMLTVLPQVQERAWPQLADCCGYPEWAEDERFATRQSRRENNTALIELLAAAFFSVPWSEWKSRFDERGITAGHIAKHSDHSLDEQALVNGMIVEYEADPGSKTVSSPIFIDGSAKRAVREAPTLGEHNRPILAELEISGN
ncbi:MAG: CoA transferase [Pseudomonadota bacterium]